MPRFVPHTRISYPPVSRHHYIAMWSGPRNISTTMMRAWGSRPDTVVCDEPFYAHYLQQSGFDHHPGYEEVLEHHETDWRKVVEMLTAPLPEGKTIFYQKQMAHHMLGDVPMEWTDHFTSVFLIRDPREMLLSLLEFFPNPQVEESGLPQQLELYRRSEQQLGHKPVVVDSRDVLLDPRGILSELCRQVEVPFDEAMFQWSPGIHDTDGIWAKHWYDKVAQTTTFGPYREKAGDVPKQHSEVLKRCREIYEELAAHKIQVPESLQSDQAS